MNIKDLNFLRWASLLLAIALPFLAWGQYYNWQLGNLGVLQLFGLLGITAWAIMATHFILHALSVGAIQEIPKNKLYSRVSGHIVLALILLHPALLYIKQYNLGNGLPPASSINYVGQDLAIYIILGTVALMIFLAYEVWQHFAKKPFFVKNYFWIFILQFVAMGFVFIHASNIDQITQTGWFSVVWVALALFIIMSALVTIPAEWTKRNRIQ